MDLTGAGIVVGAVISGGVAIAQVVQERSVDIGAVALTFLAVFGLLAGGGLIYAAFIGDPSELPRSWREYVAVAGVVGIGLALRHLLRTVGGVLAGGTGEAVTESNNNDSSRD